MKRQIGQALGQFIIVVASGMMVYDHPPHDVHAFFDMMYQPTLQGIVAVGGIFGLSKVGSKISAAETSIPRVN